MTSVVITVYNGENYIKETIASVQAQTSEVEIIVVDDCSTDSSIEIVKKLEKQDSRITLIQNSTNKGFCESANTGIKNSQGEYILVLGQDDILEINHIETMLRYFSEKVSMVFCDYVLIDENGFVFDENNHCKHSDITIKDFCNGNSLPSPGLVIRRKSLEQAGLYYVNPKFRNYGEYYTWIKMSKIGEIVYCDAIRAKYRRHKNNITNSFSSKKVKKKLYKYQIICKKQIINDRRIGIKVKFKLLVDIVKIGLKAYVIG